MATTVAIGSLTTASATPLSTPTLREMSTGSPASRSLEPACPQGSVPTDAFRDVDADSTHGRAVNCIAWWDISRGNGGLYAPAAEVSRAQMATFIASLLDNTGGELPVTPDDRFVDDNGSVHEANINRLALAGIVGGKSNASYDPSSAVTRAQMAAFLVRAFNHLARQHGQQELEATTDYFGDDAGLVLESDINKAAASGFAGGFGDGTYRPSAAVRRDQMASFLGRVLALGVERDLASLPNSPPPSEGGPSEEPAPEPDPSTEPTPEPTNEPTPEPTAPAEPEPAPPSDTLLPGVRLESDQSRSSADGRYRLIMQSDGNLVLYGPDGAAWNSQSNSAGSFAILQDDGNFVVYGPSGSTWDAGTTGRGGTRLIVQNDGNLVLYTDGGSAVWSSKDASSGQMYLPWRAGVRWHVSQGNNESISHNGGLRYALDFDYNKGQAVVTAAPGVVHAVQRGVTGQTGSGYGNFVVIRHVNGKCTMYAHLKYGSVFGKEPGATVARAEQLGAVGNTGYTLPVGSGHHLHFHLAECNSYGTSIPLPGFVETGGRVPTSGDWLISQNG
jgi:hypothetical protein